MPCSISSVLIAAAAMAVTVGPVLADPVDWVNINYAVHQTLYPDTCASTSRAQDSIIRGAGITAQAGPWSVVKGVIAPSGNPHDYLSWAPYHWPNCNWCGGTERRHLSHVQNATESCDNPDCDSTRHSGGRDAFNSAYGRTGTRNSSDGAGKGEGLFENTSPPVEAQEFTPLSTLTGVIVGGPPTPTPTLAPTGVVFQSSASAVMSDRPANGTPAPAQAPAKTQKGGNSCTPSPTRSIASSATWTTCPYVVRDGQLNPDVRTLNGINSINGVSQSIHYNAVAYALEKTATYSLNVASFVDVFFINSTTKMNPNMNFGQVVRGPGRAGQSGTFTGILDLRDMVKVVNAVMLMKASGSPEWTDVRDQAMIGWINQYREWLQVSDIGKVAASRPNNHGSFYFAQSAALNMLGGDKDRSIANLRYYFSHQFLDQLAASGEQPFEAVRTRPFHYRCFNLEAMITNAKLGDQLGLDFWMAKSKYGATIQNAVDFTMALDPKNEDITELLPHVAAVAAAYGDPKGKYAAFLTKTMADYKTRPFWFYNQTPGLSSSPAAAAHKRRTMWAREDTAGQLQQSETQPVDFICPEVFRKESEVELDNGIFVTCDELRQFYDVVAV